MHRRAIASPINHLLAAALAVALTPVASIAQAPARPPLTAAAIDDIARLELLEDHRQLDSLELSRMLGAAHPEVRRRAALAVARINDKRGIALLRARRLDPDTAVAATVVFAVGQLRDTAIFAWYDSLLSNAKTPPTVATEAAVALGKIKTASARDVLARYLTGVTVSARTTPTIAEALLSIGRAVPRGTLAPIIRWTKSPNEELRWRAVWALFRPRDPASIPTMLAMSKDTSSLVRSWAIRALTKVTADSAKLAAPAEARLMVGTRDSDRRVRTEAVRALATYGDSAATAALVTALAATDTWVSVSAAEGLGRLRATSTVPALVAATGANRPCALRVTAMQALQAFAPHEALAAAGQLARDSSAYCRATGLQAVMRDSTRPIAARRADISSADPDTRLAALRAMSMWADTTDLAGLLDLYETSRNDPSSGIATAAAQAIAGIQRRHGIGASAFFARFTPPDSPLLRRDVDRAFGAAARQAWPPVVPPSRTVAEYRDIVERWVVPDYEGKPRPTARWETTRGAIELELYPGDAPLAVEDFVKTMQAGTIVGTEFTRVVADFVDQQATIRGGVVLRDEVNRHRLTRANLAWATAGLDTGAPGYTLNHTPQPHNEGDFTSMGHVVRGMDVVDRIELGDRVTAARMLTGPPR